MYLPWYLQACQIDSHMTSSPPKRPNSQPSEGRLDSKMASGSERSGKSHIAGEDVTEMRVSIDDLPDEVLLMIFSHLSFSELIDVVRNVCHRWRRLYKVRKLWHNKEYHIGVSKHCDSDSCRCSTNEREVIRTFMNAPYLRKVHLWQGVTSHVIYMLSARCHKLLELRLPHTQKLTHLMLDNLFEKCSQILKLRISYTLLSSEKCVKAVTHLKYLRVLDLLARSREENSGTLVLPPGVLQPLYDSCPRLARVDFGCLHVNISDLWNFLNAKRSTLEYIRVKWAMDRTRTGGLPKLRHLLIWYASGLEDDTVVAIIRGCPALQLLAIRDAHLVSDAAFCEISHLEHLETLDVSCCRGLTGAFFPHLTALPRLHTLRMEKMDFTKLQPGLNGILELSGVRCLRLDYSRVTGVPFDQFPGKLISLRELKIPGCVGDPKATDGLAERMPDLQICGSIEAEQPALEAAYCESDTEL
ncbi:F-box/LRR-repeat protein 7-like isoform X2 [Schistocerca americana]|uniref:F-box/LRR-repeat protein 7-like isoform X2 n=1 Tax=Schistocerca americana TaxID=7009 RepID=UPI001F4F12FF|nr:F-box/LRR-repeat protein 7-like isoform X2 [Schistocerca americana]